jgi:anti-sigma regulatory factor (Ser/Thr protein kinase)
MAHRMGFEQRACWEIGIVVQELVSNIVRHASRGYLELSVHPDYLEVTAVDRGPGIPPAVIAASESSQHGLGAIRRLMHTLEISSPAEGGTLVRTRRLLGRKL